ncbi:hypothetical protein [uncultured Pseudokineococcus sp.]|uniref:hypothetical protein n=1 Tax=uncultured Pseudokineococcus sp. TaxID=1642928 RepID=UPI00262F91C6|nr:hypothetical protein [uncultured Pseudokineococcus sp.]
MRPLAVARVGNVTPGVSLVLLAWLLATDGDLGSWRWPAAVVAVPLGVYLAVRAPGCEVVCDQRGVVVRGWLWTRTVPRKAVVEVTDFPAVRWRDGRGRARWTPLSMFWTSPRMLPIFVDHSEHQVDRLRRWVRRRR